MSVKHTNYHVKSDNSQHWRMLPALGVDFGTVRIGLALAVSPIAQPLVIIPSDHMALSYIGTLISDYSVRTIVVGISERQSAERAKKFARELKNAFSPKITVVFADETLSSQLARQRLIGAGKKITEKTHIDQYAAACILEEWLDNGDYL